MAVQRNTKQKKIIYDALRCADHPTATELYEAIHAENPSISRGTVFRVLSQFAENGEAVKLSLSDSSARFDAFTHPHAHAHCIYCGRVFDLADKDVAPLFEKKSTGGFEIYSARIEFSGCCSDCKQSRETRKQIN